MSLAAAELSKKVLLKELKQLPVYREHRKTLRPWDRKLPVLVAQEADAQQHWELEPPSPVLIFLALFASLLLYQLVWFLPVYINLEHIGVAWKNIKIPGIVYDNAKVWLALWIVAHLCSGLSLWFVWLTEGWHKHVKELLPLAIAFFMECMWVDVAVYVARLDLLLVMWILIVICLATSMYFMHTHKVTIGSVFLLPHFAAAMSMIVYSAAFVNLHGSTYVWEGDKARAPTPTPTA